MKIDMTPAEAEIMGFLWEAARWTTIKEMSMYFEENGKSWKRQTINTFLAHLIQKGLVIKNGRKYIYAFSKEEYKKIKASDILDTLYDGSIKEFVSALYGTNKLSHDDAEELRAYLDQYEEK